MEQYKTAGADIVHDASFLLQIVLFCPNSSGMETTQRAREIAKHGTECIVCGVKMTRTQENRWLKSKDVGGPFCTRGCGRAYAMAAKATPAEQRTIHTIHKTPAQDEAPVRSVAPVPIRSVKAPSPVQFHPDASRVIDYFTSRFPDSAVSARTPESYRIVSDRLQSFTAEQLMEAADGLGSSAFHTNKGYMTIKSAYGTPEKVERMRYTAKNPAGANVTPREIERRATEALRERERQAEREREDREGHWLSNV